MNMNTTLTLSALCPLVPSSSSFLIPYQNIRQRRESPALFTHFMRRLPALSNSYFNQDRSGGFWLCGWYVLGVLSLLRSRRVLKPDLLVILCCLRTGVGRRHESRFWAGVNMPSEGDAAGGWRGCTWPCWGRGSRMTSLDHGQRMGALDWQRFLLLLLPCQQKNWAETDQLTGQVLIWLQLHGLLISHGRV